MSTKNPICDYGGQRQELASGDTLPAAALPVFGASGASHSIGAVPDPGASAGTTKYLREDGTWSTPAGGGGGVGFTTGGGDGKSLANTQTGTVGQVTAVGIGTNEVNLTIYNTNVSTTSIILVSTQGSTYTTAVGPYVTQITAVASGSFSIRIKRQSNNTITASENPVINYAVLT